MDNVLQDIRHGIRVLASKPIYTFIAVLTLALGIGASSAIFSVVNAVLLRPLPYPDSERIVRLWENDAQRSRPKTPLSPANFVDWASRNQVFDEIGAYQSWSANLTGLREPDRLQGALVSASVFQLLGVTPQIGRPFLPEEDQPGHNLVVVVSDSLWRRLLDSDPTILSKSVTINGKSYSVIGVMPPGFDFPSKAEIWSPIAFDADDLSGRGTRYVSAIARLKNGVTVLQAQANMESIAAQLANQYPKTNEGYGATVIPLYEQIVGDIRPALLILLGAVTFVLLIACVNVSNLLLARAATRQREFAVRLAIGATRSRLIQQLLTESLVLALLGGALGILLAYKGLGILLALNPAKVPRINEITIDTGVLLITILISILTGLTFGILPALKATKPNVNEALKEGDRSSGSGFSGRRFLNMLVIAEVSLSFVLLVGAGLMVKSFFRLLSVDSGFNPHNVLTMQISLPSYKYSDTDKQAAFYEQLVERVRSLPGVTSAGTITYLPLSGSNMEWIFSIQDHAPMDGEEQLTAEYREISSDYFRAMGIPLVKGREFTANDKKGAPGVIIINGSMARRFFPGEDPIGKVIGFGKKPDWREIVGVVGDVRHFSLDKESKPEAYVPHLQDPWRSMALVVRTTSDPMQMARSVRSEVFAVDPEQPVYSVASMESLINDSVEPQRLSMLLLTMFAAIALILASVGIYGVMAYSVSQRTHEIGVRMALGANPLDVCKMVLGQGMRLIVIGVLLGISAAYILTGVMSSLLYNVSRADPMIFGGITAILAFVALVANYVPARRATKVDPMIAIRYE
jgi:putative ABC transport system permease protein